MSKMRTNSPIYPIVFTTVMDTRIKHYVCQCYISYKITLKEFQKCKKVKFLLHALNVTNIEFYPFNAIQVFKLAKRQKYNFSYRALSKQIEHIKIKITKKLNSKENSKRKVPNPMAK